MEKKYVKPYDSGLELQHKVAKLLEGDLGFKKANSRVYKGAFWNESERVFTEKCYLGKTIYGTKRKVDFVLWNPLNKQETVIECKKQMTPGSVDEKLPYLVSNIKVSNTPTIVIIEGPGYKQGARDWLKSCEGKNNLELVLEFIQFEKLAKKNGVLENGKKHWIFNR